MNISESDPSKSSEVTASTNAYRYVPVNQFTPLTNTNWEALYKVSSGTQDTSNPYLYWLEVYSIDRNSQTPGNLYKVAVQVVSVQQNIFRVRFDQSASYQDKVFGPVTTANLDHLRANDIAFRKFSFTDNTLTFHTNDLTVTIDASFNLSVVFNGNVIHQDAKDSNGYSLGATFVSSDYGNAVATIKKNNKDSSSIKERFYGQGEVNVSSGKSVANGGYYVQGKTGLSMTNYNYDQISYVHPELAPIGYEGLDTSIPNYYYPMYFSAPWLIALGNYGQSDQYAYGIFLDNPSQTYSNTGDTFFGEGVGATDKFYLGAQNGELDYYFVFGSAKSSSQQAVHNVVMGLNLLTQDPEAAHFKAAAMPPKYIFGYFQGVYGAIGVNHGAFPSGCTLPDNSIFFEDIYNGYNSLEIPLEGFAVDIDVQDTYNVFTTNSRFWVDGDTSGTSIFEWAHDNDLVTQTNITCFIKDQETVGGAYSDLVNGKYYVKNTGADSKTFNTDGHGPDDAYCAQLQYGDYAKTTAIFPDWGKTGTAEWWGPNYENLFDIGLDFVWQDMTTPSADAHIIGQEVTDDEFDLTTLQFANIADPSSDSVAYANTFNWRSYHMQAYLTDPRYGDQALRTFAETRNQHAYSLCAATYSQGIVNTVSSRKKFERSYIIARGGQIGSGKFGGLWMGDNSSDWQHLNLMVPMIVSMNMSGMSVVGADIGGFAQADSDYNSQNNEGNPPSPELLTRWVQAGFLLPWFRNHYDRWISLDPSTSDTCADWQPKQHGKPYQEIFNAAYSGTAANNKTYQTVMKEAIDMRYRWQEVLYYAANQYASGSVPMIKSMCMWNNDANIDFDVKPGLNSQFLLGGSDGYSILAAPVVTEGQTSRGVYLPTDSSKDVNWFPFAPGEDDTDVYQYYTGGQDITITADISTTPVFVRQGAILPTRYTSDGGVKSINSYTTDDPLVFDVFSTASGADGNCYVDDGGVTTNAEDNNTYSLLEVTTSNLASTTVSYNVFYPGIEKHTPFAWGGLIYLRLRAVGTVTDVKVNGSSATKVTASTKYDFFSQVSASGSSYWIDTTSGSVWVQAPAIGPTSASGPTTANIVISCSDTINRSTTI